MNHRGTLVKLNYTYPRVLRELLEMIAKPLSTIYLHSWSMEEVPEDWRLATVIPTYKRSHKEDPGTTGPSA